MTNKAIKILAVGLIVGLFAFGYYKVDRFLKIDTCLDHGGRWNYGTNKCDTLTTNIGSLTSDSTKKTENIQTETAQISEHGYNELADDDDRERYEISDYNTDNLNTPNIKRPEKTLIINPAIDTTSLFRIWVKYADAPHATFKIDSKTFYVVDYDGDGAMPYILNKDSLTVYYNDFIQRGRIIKVTKDILAIQWSDSKIPTNYLEWRN